MAEYDEFSALVRGTHFAIKEATKIEYLTIVQGESSIHFHLWFFPWAQNVIKQFGPPTLTKIREIMIEYKKQKISETGWGKLQESIEKIKAGLLFRER